MSHKRFTDCSFVSLTDKYSFDIMRPFLIHIQKETLKSTSPENLWQRPIQLLLLLFFQYSLALIPKRECLVGAGHIRCGESGTPLLGWRHKERDSVSYHRRLDCLLNGCSGADQRKHQSSASLAFVGGIHRWPVNSPHKEPLTRKMFPFDDVIIFTDISIHGGAVSVRDFQASMDWINNISPSIHIRGRRRISVKNMHLIDDIICTGSWEIPKLHTNNLSSASNLWQ